MNRQKGSVSIFMALVLLFLVGMLTTIIELSIINTTKAEIDISGYNAQRSLAGYYHNELWEKYDILAVDFSKDRLGIFKDYLQDTTNPNVIDGTGLLKVRYSNISLLPRFLTQEGGYEFFRQASQNMKYKIPADLLNKLKGGDLDSEIANEKKRAKEQEEKDVINDWEKKYNVKDEKARDPRKITDKLKTETGFYDFVSKGEKVSNKGINSLVKTEGRFPKVNLVDEALFNEYILSHFTSKVTSKDNKASLDYELEYIVAGKSTDEANLRSVSNRLKLIRFPLNYAYLINEPSLRAGAEVTALILAGWTLQPGVVKMVKYGILAGWAYAETAVDVKGLLEGKKVPLLKDKTSWNLGYSAIFKLGSVKAKDNRKGLTYEGYIRMILLAQNNARKVRRSLNVIQNNLVKNDSGIKISYMAYAFDSKFDVRLGKNFFNPIFLNNNLYEHKFIAGYRYR